MLLEVTDILARLATLKETRKPYEALWKDITEYVLPRRSFWDLDSTPGQKAPQKICDGTALDALQTLADGLQSGVVSAKLRWFRLTLENKKLQNLPGVADWLEEVEDVLYAEFARSNFYEAISEFFLDSGSIGTAVMLVEDEVAEGRILFSTRHIKECYIAESRTGMVDTLYREFYLTNRQALQTWGKKLSVERQELAKTAPFGRGKYVHAVFPRRERDPRKIDQANKAWASVYIDVERHEDKVLDEGGVDAFPYMVWRWRKNSDEIYGRSPAADAIYDVLRLNQVAMTSLQAGQLAVQPPLNVPEAMRGKERIVPRGFNYYEDPNKIIYPINLGQNYAVSKDQENELRDQIKAIFRSKIFLLMEQLQGGPYTATEIRERIGEKVAVLGSILDRLDSETLVPAIDRTYTICERNGLLPPAPEALQTGGRIHVEFMGLLRQAQKQYHQSMGIVSGMAFIGGMRDLFPESMDNVDADELMRIGMDSQGMPQKVIRETPQVTEIRQIRQQVAAKQQQQAVALEQQKMLAANAEKLNQPLQKGSMLAGVTRAAGQPPPGQ